MGNLLSYSLQRTASSSSSSDGYVSQDEVDRYEAAKQRMMEEMVQKQKAIDRYFSTSMKNLQSQVALDNAASSSLPSDNRLVVLQRDFNNLPLLRRIYHEAPDDIFELILSNCSDVNRMGSLNVFRLVNKRCKQAVESQATMLTNEAVENGPDSFPVGLDLRCKRMEHIKCYSLNLKSLKGCPSGLKSLHIGDAPNLSDLSPLARCSMMTALAIDNSSIADISAVAHMPYLERFALQKDEGRPSVIDLSPFFSCPFLKELFLGGNDRLEDLSPLSSCAALEELEINLCPFIVNLDPLSNLKNLAKLHCWGINPEASLHPLVSCTGLKKVWCHDAAMDLGQVKELTKGQVKFLCSLFFTVFYADEEEMEAA